jgi:Fe-S-cluster-containing dehydrogenase component
VGEISRKNRYTGRQILLYKKGHGMTESKPGTGRRRFLKSALSAGAALPLYGAWSALLPDSGEVILENAKGMIVADSTRCVGCKLCELACTEFNEGRSQPSLARVKISRNYNFGPRGQQAGFNRGMGEFGNLRLVQDVCLQCPHPVPCATACPYGAIVMDPKTGARVVDQKKCRGCRVCQRACPWEMTTFNETTAKASKCFLCNGEPECVAVCPTGALRFVSWNNLTKAVPVRQAILPVAKDYVSAGCSNCHSKRR